MAFLGCPHLTAVVGSLPDDTKARILAVPGAHIRGSKLLVAWHAVAATEQALQEANVGISAARWAVPPADPKTWEEVESELKAQNEMRDFVFEPGFLLPHQVEGTVFGAEKTGFHLHTSTGSGKTLIYFLWMLLAPGPVVLVTRAAARLQLGREVQRYTQLEPFVIRLGGRVSVERARARFAEIQADLVQEEELNQVLENAEGATPKDQKKLNKAKEANRARLLTLHDQRGRQQTRVVRQEARAADTLDAYLSRVERPVVIVGWEALADNLDRIIKIGPTSVVFDELHVAKSSKRYTKTPLPTLPDPAEAPEEHAAALAYQVEQAKAAGGFLKENDGSRVLIAPKDNLSMAARKLGQVAKRRCGATATPIANTVSDLWAQLDAVEPNGWGSAHAWQLRYANKHRNNLGYMEAKGESNVAELKARLSQIVFSVPYAQTHRSLPPKRRQSVYVAPEDQVASSGSFAKELIEAKARGAGALLEVRLAEAASRKRKAVLGIIGDHVGSGQKVVVFTARRRDVEDLGKLVSAEVGKQAPVWAVHGGHSQEARDDAVRSYMESKGPAVLISTGHSLGTSINLHDSDALLFVMLPYTPEALRQWEGRVARVGQKRPVIIYFVIAEGTADEHVADLLISKLPAVERVVGDSELAAAGAVIGGIEDPEALAAGILAKLDLSLDFLDD